MSFIWSGNAQLSRCKLEDGTNVGWIRRGASGHGYVAYGTLRQSDELSEFIGASVYKDKAKNMVIVWYKER